MIYWAILVVNPAGSQRRFLLLINIKYKISEKLFCELGESLRKLCRKWEGFLIKSFQFNFFSFHASRSEILKILFGSYKKY